VEVTGCVAWPGVGRFTPWATPVAGCAAGRGSATGAIVGGTAVPAAGGVTGGWVAAGTAGVGVVGGTISAMGGGATAWGGIASKVIVSVSGEAKRRERAGRLQAAVCLLTQRGRRRHHGLDWRHHLKQLPQPACKPGDGSAGCLSCLAPNSTHSLEHLSHLLARAAVQGAAARTRRSRSAAKAGPRLEPNIMEAREQLQRFLG
jgi:hypothetical protein